MKVSSLKIAFVGNMNNFPYMYAREMRKRGLDVTIFLDRPVSYLLDRPESLEPEFRELGLPDWIKESKFIFPSQFISFSFPLIFHWNLINKLKEFDVIFFNGNLISLGQFIKEEKVVIHLFSGADLDVAADYQSKNFVISSIYEHSFKKIIPKIFLKWIFPFWVGNQRKGIRRGDLVSYFPTGIVPRADELLNEVMKGKKFERLEIRAADSEINKYSLPDRLKKKFTILSFVRFHYLAEAFDNKRNDIILKGIALFLSEIVVEKPIEIILFEKGKDLEHARILCNRLGLSPYIKWVKVVSYDKLIDYIKDSDVVFDQLGSQLIGAGFQCMLIGRPIIANGRPEIFRPLIGEDSPVCQAVNEQEVAYWLKKLYHDQELVIEIGKKCRKYVLDHFHLNSTIEYFINFIESKKV